MTLYLDILYLVNCYVTALLLFSARYLAQIYVPPKRIFWSALIGGLFSFLFLLNLPSWLLLFVKLFLAAILTLIAFGKDRFGKKYLCFLVVNVLYGGILYAIELMDASSMIWIRNGIAYFPVSAGFLCVATIVIYALLWLYTRIHFGVVSERQFFWTELSDGQTSVRVKTLCDTGHQLTDPVTGLPVLICQADQLRGLLSPADYTGLLAMRPDGLSPPLRRRFQLIYAHSIGGNSAMPALRMERCRVLHEKHWSTRSAVVALSFDPLSDGSYQAIAGPGF